MSDHKRKQFYLIDGNAYMYRSFYAIRELTTSQGKPTNALYGFINFILKIQKEYKPDYLAVAFDSKGPTTRHKIYDQYKIHRKPMPEDLVPQMDEIHQILDAFNIPVYKETGHEADDIMATLARDAEKHGMDVIMVTGDKDMLQLVNEHIKMLSIHKDATLYDVDEVKKKYGIAPEYIVDYLGLAGDSADHIPGVPGVGAKTATKLIQQLGHMEDILDNIDQIKSISQQQKFREFADQARLSKVLATLDQHVPGFDVAQDCIVKEPDEARLRDLFHEYEFFKFIREMGLQEPDLVLNKVDIHMDVETLSDPQELVATLHSDDVLVFFKQEGFLAFKVIGQDKAYILPWCSDDHVETLLHAKASLWGFDVKPLCKEFRLWERDDCALFDIKLAAYVLYPGKSKYELSQLVEEYAQMGWQEGESEEVWAHNLYALETLVLALKDKLETDQLSSVFNDLEQPLSFLLARMEAVGVNVDAPFLKILADKYEIKLEDLTTKIYTEAGSEFNINSPKQLAVVLFDDLGLPPAKKTKTGYSTGVEVLEKLAEEYVLPGLILEYRQFFKLKSTYIDALPKLINPQTGRIHTTLHQEVAATGRLSSSEPNLQNIPIRTQEGRDIRKAFIAENEHSVIVSADYSQIELRVLAHMSDDPKMKEAFLNYVDIHRKTAAEVMGLPEDDVTDEMRRTAKAINFGLIYGKTPFGLSKDLGIPIFQAKEFIEAYFLNFPSIRGFMDEMITFAQEHGYVETLYHRRRYIPEINAKNKMRREFAERMAINSPVQGTAADIIKIAMLKVDAYLREHNFKTKFMLQIHDELLFEAPQDEVKRLQEEVTKIMEEAVILSVPLVVNIAAADNWAEAH